MSKHIPGERMLVDLRRELRGIGWRARSRAIEEARDHLICAYEDEIASGASPEDAEARALERFGSAVVVAERFRARPGKRLNRAVPVAVGVALLTGALALPAGPVREDLTAPPAGAATVPQVTAAHCVRAWNARANARWRAYAVRIATRRAYVGGSVGMNPRTGVIVAQACVVKLWLERQAGPWQNAIYVYGAWKGGTAQYGVTGKKTAGTHRARLRTSAQWSNARIQPNGALTLRTGTSS